MKCADIMNTNLEWLNEKDTVLTAASVMADTGVGFLPICDSRQRVIGVVTDRDLVTRALAGKVVPATTSAALVMTAPAVTCLATADVREAERLMVREQKTRLVITEADGRLAGVLSLVDLIEQAPAKEGLQTARAVLGRDALGPRGGAAKGEPLLKDDPFAGRQALSSGDGLDESSVFTGGHRNTGTKTFPG